VGSGGSLCGAARALRAVLPHVRVVAVDAVGSVIFGQPDQPKRLQSGLGNSLVPGNVDRSVIDEVHWLSDAEAFGATLELARREQIFAGNSSGSVYAVGCWYACTMPSGTRIVSLLPDRGDRYVETVFDPDYRHRHGLPPDSRMPEGPVQVELGTAVNAWSFARLAPATD
jgi:cysteine synthase